MKTQKIDITTLEKLRTVKLSFNGQTKEMNVYRIPIDSLFYNENNGRIATFISQYEQDGKKIVDLDNNEFNDEISKFIKQSETSTRFKTTKEDIKINSQKKEGVVLTDGRIIDGNRRFTCLRELYKETGDQKFGYFEAVVLEAPRKDDVHAWKAIGSLELEIQIGVDEKVSYDPVEWLVRVYKDMVKNKTYSYDEYARYTRKSIKTIKQEIAVSELMVDFLSFFNKDGLFHIAKRLKVDGPLKEVYRLSSKLTKAEFDKIKSVFYIYLWGNPKGDTTREVRKLVEKRSNNPFEFNRLVEKANSDAEEILNRDNPSLIKRAKNDENLPSNAVPSKPENEGQKSGNTLVQLVKKSNEDDSKKKALNKPITTCESVLKNLDTIDNSIVNLWKDSNLKTQYKKLLDDIIEKVEGLKKHVS